MASTRKRTHIAETVQQLLTELPLTIASLDGAHRKTATRIHWHPVSIAQGKLVNTRSVQAFKPGEDFRGIEGNNAVLTVVFARFTKPFKRIFVQYADELSPCIAVVGDEPLNFFRLLRRILIQALLGLELISPQAISIATPQPIGLEGDAATPAAGAKRHDLIGLV